MANSVIVDKSELCNIFDKNEQLIEVNNIQYNDINNF